jgi:hypothetical protein
LVSFAIGASNFLKNKHHFSKTAGLLDSGDMVPTRRFAPRTM